MRPVTVSKCSVLLPPGTSEINDLSIVEVPTDATWEANSIASFGELKQHRHILSGAVHNGSMTTKLIDVPGR